MKTKTQIVAFATLLVLTGCTPNKPSGGSSSGETPGSAQAVTESSSNTPTMAENKQTFVAAMDLRLKDLDVKIDELAQKSGTFKDTAKAQADQTLAALREQRVKLESQFDELKNSSGQAWKELQTGCETAMRDLEQAYEKAKSKFS